jgi:hypothetical protein
VHQGHKFNFYKYTKKITVNISAKFKYSTFIKIIEACKILNFILIDTVVNYIQNTLLQQPRLFPTHVTGDAGPQHKADGIFPHAHIEYFRLHVGFFRRFPTFA